MNTARRPARLTLSVPLAVPLAVALCGLLLLTGCGIPASVSTANRPDMTAPVPPSGDRHAHADRHGKAKHPKARHAKVKRVKAKPALRAPGTWVETVDRSGVRFSLPYRVAARSSDNTVTSLSLPTRLFDTFTADGSEVAVLVSDLGVHRGQIDSGSLVLGVDRLVGGMRTAGIRDAKVVNSRPTTIGGRQGMDFEVSFSADGSHRYWLFRYVFLPNALVLLESVGAGPDAAAAKDRGTRLHRRLTDSLRLG
jgi:hypothetical protein